MFYVCQSGVCRFLFARKYQPTCRQTMPIHLLREGRFSVCINKDHSLNISDMTMDHEASSTEQYAAVILEKNV